MRDTINRDLMLQEGKEIDGFWFNKELSNDFFAVMNTSINIGRKSFKWINTKGEIVDVTIGQAKKMSAIMLDEVAAIYFKNLKGK